MCSAATHPPGIPGKRGVAISRENPRAKYRVCVQLWHRAQPSRGGAWHAMLAIIMPHYCRDVWLRGKRAMTSHVRWSTRIKCHVFARVKLLRRRATSRSICPVTWVVSLQTELVRALATNAKLRKRVKYFARWASLFSRGTATALNATSPQ